MADEEVKPAGVDTTLAPPLVHEDAPIAPAMPPEAPQRPTGEPAGPVDPNNPPEPPAPNLGDTSGTVEDKPLVEVDDPEAEVPTGYIRMSGAPTPSAINNEERYGSIEGNRVEVIGIKVGKGKKGGTALRLSDTDYSKLPIEVDDTLLEGDWFIKVKAKI